MEGIFTCEIHKQKFNTIEALQLHVLQQHGNGKGQSSQSSTNQIKKVSDIRSEPQNDPSIHPKPKLSFDPGLLTPTCARPAKLYTAEDSVFHNHSTTTQQHSSNDQTASTSNRAHCLQKQVKSLAENAQGQKCFAETENSSLQQADVDHTPRLYTPPSYFSTKSVTEPQRLIENDSFRSNTDGQMNVNVQYTSSRITVNYSQSSAPCSNNPINSALPSLLNTHDSIPFQQRSPNNPYSLKRKQTFSTNKSESSVIPSEKGGQGSIVKTSARKTDEYREFLPDGSAIPKCFRCNQLGHVLKHCKMDLPGTKDITRKLNESSSTSASSSKRAHKQISDASDEPLELNNSSVLDVNCPSRKTDRYREVLPDGSAIPKCFKCNEVGHVSKYCKGIGTTNNNPQTLVPVKDFGPAPKRKKISPLFPPSEALTVTRPQRNEQLIRRNFMVKAVNENVCRKTDEYREFLPDGSAIPKCFKCNQPGHVAKYCKNVDFQPEWKEEFTPDRTSPVLRIDLDYIPPLFHKRIDAQLPYSNEYGDQCMTPLNYPHSGRKTDDYREFYPDGTSIPKCFKCDQFGHIAKYCKIQNNPQEEKPDLPLSSALECSKCDQFGHVSQYCENLDKKTNQYREFLPDGRSVPTCYKCNKSGHVAKYCKSR